MGPILSMFAWWAHQQIKMKIDNSSEKIKYRNWDGTYIVFLSLMNIGNALHTVTNMIGNVAAKDFHLESTRVFHELYFYDEFIGHTLQIGSFLMMALINFNISLNKSIPNRLQHIEWLYPIGIGIGFGIGFAYAMIDGQSWLPVFVINCFFIIPITKAIKKLKIGAFKDNPLILLYILYFSAYMITILVYLATEGFLLHYPFLPQWST
jgi:hypothetical protein